MVEKKNFMLPEMLDGDFTSEELADEYEGLQLSFPRVKIPAGGALQFEIPSDNPEDPDYAKTLEGVILYSHSTGAYWPEGSEYDDNVSPLCSSLDGKMGYGTPGGVRIEDNAFERLRVVGILGVVTRNLKLQSAACGNLYSREGELQALVLVSKLFTGEVTVEHFGKHKVLLFYHCVFVVVSHNILISLILKICC